MARVSDVIRRNSISQVAPQAAPAGQGFAAIAQLAKIGEDFVRPKALEQSREAGEASVYRDENGTLQVDERSVLGGEMADAHNAAAYAKYLAQKQMDVSETMTELATEYEFDPAGFQAAARSYVEIQEQDESVPRALKEGILAGVREESARRFNGLQNSEIDRTRSDANRNTTAARNMLVDDYVNLFVGGNLQEAEAKLAEISAITEFRVAAGYIPETDVEADAFLRGVRGAAVAAGLARNLENLSGETSITEEYRTEILDTLNNPDISPPVRSRLYTATQGVLKGVDAASIVAGLTDTSFMAQLNRASGAVDLADFAVSGAERSDSFTGMTEGFQSGLQAMMEAAPPEIRDAIRISSGFRSIERQRQLWAEALAKYGSAAEARKWVAPPGNSQHNHGNAADLRFETDSAREWAHENAAQFGLSFPLANENWHVELSTARGGDPMPGGSSAIARRDDNAAAFDATVSPNIPLTPVNEFLGMQFGIEIAVPILSRSPDTMMTDVLSEEQMAANPMFADMNVSEVLNWANRKMTMKASDMAGQQVAIDRIPDAEVRAMASANLADRVQTQTRIENQAAAAYVERLSANDDTLTVQEVMQDQTLSDTAQRQIVAKLNKKNEAQIAVQQTAMNLADLNASWNPYDSSQRRAVDDFFVAATEGRPPLSDPDDTLLAFQIAERTGFIPKTMFDALRAASNSGDPAQLAAAMEFAGQVIDAQPNALGPYGGRNDVLTRLSDYRYYGGFGTSDEAAARVVEVQQLNPPKNATEAARDAVRQLTVGDISAHFSDWSSPDFGSDVQQGAIMGDYSRLFEEEYLLTGDIGLSRNRALDMVGRAYGPNTVTGSNRIMKFPPQAFSSAVNDSQDWMRTQIETEISNYEFGEDVYVPSDAAFSGLRGAVNTLPFGALVTGDSAGGENWISADRIKLISDDQTAALVRAGRPPSYQVFYTDNDGVTQPLVKRFYFDAALVDDSTTRRRGQRREEFLQNNTTNQGQYYRLVEQFGKDAADQMIRGEQGPR